MANRKESVRPNRFLALPGKVQKLILLGFVFAGVAVLETASYGVFWTQYKITGSTSLPKEMLQQFPALCGMFARRLFKTRPLIRFESIDTVP